jgi:hypothetical protein
MPSQSRRYWQGLVAIDAAPPRLSAWAPFRPTYSPENLALKAAADARLHSVARYHAAGTRPSSTAAHISLSNSVTPSEAVMTIR